jgi:hypothetical protein
LLLRNFVVECRDFRVNGSHRLVGSGQTSLADLQRVGGSAQKRIVVELHKSGGKPAGELHFVQFNVVQEFSFLDFIASGYIFHFQIFLG